MGLKQNPIRAANVTGKIFSFPAFGSTHGSACRSLGRATVRLANIFCYLVFLFLYFGTLLFWYLDIFVFCLVDILVFQYFGILVFWYFSSTPDSARVTVVTNNQWVAWRNLTICLGG